MNAIKTKVIENIVETTHVVYTRDALSRQEQAKIRVIVSAGISLSSPIYRSDLEARYNEAVSSERNDGIKVSVRKNTYKNKTNILVILEDPIVAPEPIEEEPVPEVQTPKAQPVVPPANNDIVFDTPDDDDWGGDDEDDEATNDVAPAVEETVIPPAMKEPFMSPVVEEPVVPKAPEIPACIVLAEKPTVSKIAADMSEEAEKDIAFMILQNSTNDSLGLKNFLSDHMLNSKIATRIIGKCLRHNSGEDAVTLTDDEKEVVDEMKARIIARMGLKKTFKGNGYTIPVQSMTEYGQKYYSQFIYEEAARRLPNGETPKYLFIINVTDKSILAKTLDGSKTWHRDFNDKTINFINSRCNFKEYTKTKAPSDIPSAIPSVDYPF